MIDGPLIHLFNHTKIFNDLSILQSFKVFENQSHSIWSFLEFWNTKNLLTIQFSKNFSTDLTRHFFFSLQKKKFKYLPILSQCWILIIAVESLGPPRDVNHHLKLDLNDFHLSNIEVFGSF